MEIIITSAKDGGERTLPCLITRCCHFHCAVKVHAPRAAQDACRAEVRNCLAVSINVCGGLFEKVRQVYKGSGNRGAAFMVRDSDVNCERNAGPFETWR